MAGWHPSSGGPFVSGGNLVRTLVEAGHAVTLFTADYSHAPLADPPKGVEMLAVKGHMVPVLRQSWTPSAHSTLLNHVKSIKPDILHDNGFWRSLNHVVAKVATEQQIPRLVSLRGTLDQNALAHRAWKKKIALKFGERSNLERVDCFHATSEREVDSLRAMGLRQPIALIPNGVNIPEVPTYFKDNKKRVALFIGRIHPIKNLDLLIKAWASVRPQEWVLRIAGSSEMNHDSELIRLAQELDASDCIEISGPVYGESKDALFRSAQLFFLVSKTENFGISAAEALSYGLPVVASKNTPWKCLEECDSGRWVEADVPGIQAAIKELTCLSPSNLQAMGSNGRSYVQKELSWRTIGENFSELYAWLQVKGEVPSFIIQ